MDVGLVLGGGGARCLAHIGVLKALEQYHYTPVALSACSTGAILAALYAAGHRAAAIERILQETHVLELLDIDFDGGSGLIGHGGITAFLQEYAPERFERLEVPLAVVAVDVQTGERVVFSKGPLVPAVCASNAFPGLFDPVFHEGRHLVDGGVLDLVPVDVIRVLTTLPVIAIDVGLPVTRRVDLNTDRTQTGLLERLAARLSVKQFTLPVDLLDKAFSITQARLSELQYAMHPPDMVIRPALPDDCGTHHFDRMEEIVEMGYTTACELLETLPSGTLGNTRA